MSPSSTLYALRLAGRAVIRARHYEALALLDLTIYPEMPPGDDENASVEWVNAVRLLLRAACPEAQ